MNSFAIESKLLSFFQNSSVQNCVSTPILRLNIIVSLKKKDVENKVKTSTGVLPLTINDLRERQFNNSSLTEDERQSLINYDSYRINYLNASDTEEEFHKRYFELQAKANLAPFTEFLKDRYAE